MNAYVAYIVWFYRDGIEAALRWMMIVKYVTKSHDVPLDHFSLSLLRWWYDIMSCSGLQLYVMMIL